MGGLERRFLGVALLSGAGAGRHRVGGPAALCFAQEWAEPVELELAPLPCWEEENPKQDALLPAIARA